MTSGADRSTPLRMAVIGVGYLGRHHARILAGLDGVELVGVVDRDPRRAEEIAASVGAPVMAASDLDDVDAVTVAVPTESHRDVVVPLLERGVAALVEKPLARTLDEADDILAAADRSGATLAVGHTERHNPAVAAAIPHLRDPGFVEIHRLGTFPERSLDIDVVFDLMIHDLDVLLSTIGGDAEVIDAVGVPVLTGRVDIANARLRFDTGCVANVTASRISRERVRKVRFFQRSAYISIDYAAQEAELWTLAPAGGRPGIAGGKLEVQQDEPLKLELSDFAQAVRRRTAPRVTGADGRRALALAQRITDVIDHVRAGSTA